MKAGEEYERFIYEKLKRLFRDFDVRHDDSIVGLRSGLTRQIDISIRSAVAGVDLLFVASCKDRVTRPADVQTLGEFSAVISDVGASGGFLLCTAGFAKSNYQYARSLGIELWTIEDIASDRWNVQIQVPVLYVRNAIRYEVDLEIQASDALVERNRQPIGLTGDECTEWTRDNGRTVIRFGDLVDQRVKESGFAVAEGAVLDLLEPNLETRLGGVWTSVRRVRLILALVPYERYLTYKTPSAYSQLRDHVRDSLVPLELSIGGHLDELRGVGSLIVEGVPLPVLPGLTVAISEVPSSFADLKPFQHKRFLSVNVSD
jgi:Restriction endonuclease